MTIADERTTGDVNRRPGTANRSRGRVGAADKPRASRSPAAQRALDRRRKRLAKRPLRGSGGPATEIDAGGRAARRSTVRAWRSPLQLLHRVPFVVVVIGVLLLGLILTLWLSTRSAQDSYRLGIERDRNQALTNQRDALKKTFESGNSAPELAKKAGAQGMVLSTNAARLAVGPDGNPMVLGTPTAAAGAPERLLNSPPASSPTPSNPADAQRNPADRTANGGSTQQTPVSAPTPDVAPQAPTQIATNVLPQGGGNAPTPNSTNVR